MRRLWMTVAISINRCAYGVPPRLRPSGQQLISAVELLKGSDDHDKTQQIRIKRPPSASLFIRF